MTKFLNNLKNKIIYSKSLPKIYTFFTKPFDRSLRHLTDSHGNIIDASQKISVIIPNYNYARYLDTRIDSIVDQTYPISELIILDDASTDDSDEVIKNKIKSLRESHKSLKIKYLRNEINTGKPILQWKKAFEEATGDFVWIAEADDVSDYRFLEKVMPLFDDEEVILAYSDSVAINDKGNVLHYHMSSRAGKHCKPHLESSFVINGMEERKICLNQHCTISNVSAVVFRKKGNITYGKYLKEASDFFQVGDWYFYLKLARHGRIAFLHESLNYFRIHRGSVTRENEKKEKTEEEIAYIHSHLDMI